MACGEYFEQLWGIRYRRTVLFFTLFSWLVSNQGLTQLIKVSVPVLVGLYPLAIVLVLLSLAQKLWHDPQPVFRVCMAVALVFGALDGLTATGFSALSGLLGFLPLAEQQMGWVLPVAVVLLGMTVRDRWQHRLHGN